MQKQYKESLQECKIYGSFLKAVIVSQGCRFAAVLYLISLLIEYLSFGTLVMRKNFLDIF